MIKIKFIFTALLALNIGVLSATEPHLIILNSSNKTSVPLNQIKRLSFTDEGMEIIGNRVQLIPFSEITSIGFDFNTDSGINKLYSNENFNKLSFHICNQTISIKGLEDKVSVEIYSISGEKLISIHQYNGEDINISELSNGVYIMKIGNQIFKFIK